MSKVANPLEDHEVEFVDEDDGSVDESKKAESGFTPTQKVSWPHGSAMPPKEPEGPLDAGKRTRGEGAKINRVLDNREEAERARQDDHRNDSYPGGSIEAKWAAGFSKIAGKHVANPGLLTRGGRAKILPESVDQQWMETHAWELERIANQVLSGPNASIFEALVIKPLLDGRRRTTEEVQEQARKFGKSEKRIYKILDRCRKKVINNADKPKPGGFSEEERAQRWREFQSENEANKLRLKAAAQKAATTEDHVSIYYGGSPPSNKDRK